MIFLLHTFQLKLRSSSCTSFFSAVDLRPAFTSVQAFRCGSMASPSGSAYARRSSRFRTPTLRAQQYKEERGMSGLLVPRSGDEISVKWILNNQPVWWPATVMSADELDTCTRKCAGSLLYHKLDQYVPVLTSVQFSTSASNQRFVTSLCSSSKGEKGEPSSWVYRDEKTSDSDCASHDGSYNSASLSVGEFPSKTADLNNPNSAPQSAQHKRRSSGHGKSYKTDKSKNVNRAHLLKVSNSIRKGKPSVELQSHDPKRMLASSVTDQEEQNPVDTDKKTQGHYADDTAIKESMDIAIRVGLIERQLQRSSKEDLTTLCSSTISVIVSLRWALLKALEKPLKPADLAGFAEHGLAYQKVTATSQCDYSTFRDIADMLAKEHKFASDDPTKSRVAFSPSFQTIQSGSSASNNLNILFSCLADLTTFLRIRDDNDYESILSKEAVNDKYTLLRILGTFNISDASNDSSDWYNNDSQTKSNGASTSTKSISASSEHHHVLSIFVGSSPVQYRNAASPRSATTIGNSSTEDKELYRSTVFEQECRHFCSNQKCYKMPWKTKNIDSKMSVNSTFNLDGTVQKGQHNSYFVLNWSRQPAPSSVKWTQDVQDVGNCTPGCLRLSVPTVVMTASRNVRSLVSLLDNHIETFMRMRAKMHIQSSFK